jgi:hypothetical protein
MFRQLLIFMFYIDMLVALILYLFLILKQEKGWEVSAGSRPFESCSLGPGRPEQR